VVFPGDRVTIVGILNVTPDSFSDGGRFARPGPAVEAGLALFRAGAALVDVGGESTRPGAEPVPEAEEIARVRPVVEALAPRVPVSVDTRKAAVAEVALAAGARAVNDVSGGRHDPRLLRAVARAGAWVVLGHLRGEPATMQDDVRFEDVVREVTGELGERVERALEAGISRERIAVDPGLGFGKHREHNLALLARVGTLRERLGLPVLVGPSRKAFLGQLTGAPVDDRDAATHAACAVAVFAGADAVRVHDVAGTVPAVRVASALREARRKAEA